MIRKGNKYIMVIRTPKDLEEIRNNIDKYKSELKDGELIEIQIAKSGKYMLKMSLSKEGVKYEISGDDKKHVLKISSYIRKNEFLTFLPLRLVSCFAFTNFLSLIGLIKSYR